MAEEFKLRWRYRINIAHAYLYFQQGRLEDAADAESVANECERQLVTLEINRRFI